MNDAPSHLQFISHCRVPERKVTSLQASIVRCDVLHLGNPHDRGQRIERSHCVTTHHLDRVQARLKRRLTVVNLGHVRVDRDVPAQVPEVGSVEREETGNLRL